MTKTLFLRLMYVVYLAIFGLDTVLAIVAPALPPPRHLIDPLLSMPARVTVLVDSLSKRVKIDHRLR